MLTCAVFPIRIAGVKYVEMLSSNLIRGRAISKCLVEQCKARSVRMYTSGRATPAAESPVNALRQKMCSTTLQQPIVNTIQSVRKLHTTRYSTLQYYLHIHF